MSDLEVLYQEVIMDHGRRPRNFCVLEKATHQKEGFNPVCGDRLMIYIEEQDNSICDASFTGKGCAISMASASLMIEAIKGKTMTDVKTLFHDFHEGIIKQNTDSLKKLGKLAVLSGVSHYPSRIKCATLAWHALIAAMNNQSCCISTE